MFFFKNKKNKAIKDISEIMNYLHNRVMWHLGHHLPDGYWKDAYICALYCNIIDLFSEKLLTSESYNMHETVMSEVLNPIVSNEYNVTFFIADYKVLAAELPNQKTINSNNFDLGIIHGNAFYETHVGIATHSKWINLPHLKKARELETELNLNNSLDNNDTSHLSMALIEIYSKDYIKNKFNKSRLIQKNKSKNDEHVNSMLMEDNPFPKLTKKEKQYSNEIENRFHCKIFAKNISGGLSVDDPIIIYSKEYIKNNFNHSDQYKYYLEGMSTDNVEQLMFFFLTTGLEIKKYDFTFGKIDFATNDKDEKTIIYNTYDVNIKRNKYSEDKNLTYYFLLH